MSETQVCKVCRRQLSVYEYYRYKSLWKTCKECSRKRAARWAESHPELMRRYAREYQRRVATSPAAIEVHRERLRADRKERPLAWKSYEDRRNKDGLRAKGKIAWAIESGRMIRPNNCSECLIDCKPEAHHPEYYRPYDVIWLCRSCHAKTWRVMDGGNDGFPRR